MYSCENYIMIIRNDRPMDKSNVQSDWHICRKGLLVSSFSVYEHL
jgi:hypothetical protein